MARALFRVHNLSKSFGWRNIFRGISFIVNSGEKTAVVGPNGIGKTTLMRIIAGLETASEGRLQYLHDQVICGYLPQQPDLPPWATPRELLQAEHARLGPAARCDVSQALGKFGFFGIEAHLQVHGLSGGQKTRLAIARMWLAQPDLLLLDEPTNHLDREGIEWLEGFVQDYPHTVLVISHDRYFLDQVATRVLEMSANAMTEYPGNYTSYRHQKAEALRQQLLQYETQQKEIRRIEKTIDRQMRWFRSAHKSAGVHDFYRAKAKKAATRAKSTVSRLERLKQQKTEKPRPEQAISFDMPLEERKGPRLYIAEGLGKAYGKVLFRDADFAIFRGDRIGLIGPNGCGKTTLIRILLGQVEPTWGSVWASPSLRPGYLQQELGTLDPSLSLLQSVMTLFPWQTKELQQRVRHMLASFLFNQDDWEKPIEVLSEGEKRRVALIRLLLGEHNVLLVDEPTNHLDLPAREKLEEAMRAYSGTLLIASHDRYLIKNVCTRIFAIRHESIDVYPGTYEEYLGRASSCPRNQTDATPHVIGATQSDDERLLLETRLAWLSAQLEASSKDPGRAQELETEFFAVSKALRAMRE